MFWQHSPPTLTVLVLLLVEPIAPELIPGDDGWAKCAHGWLRICPPYDRQKSIPKYMPDM